MKIKLFDELTRSFKVVKVFRSNADQIRAIDFSPNGEQLISCSEDDQVCVYNCDLGLQTALLNTKKYGVDHIRFTYENSTAIHSSTKIDDKIRYLNLNDNKYFHYFTGHAKKVVSLSVSPSNNTFLSTSLDNTLRVWDLRLPNCQNVLHFSGRTTAAYDPEGLIFAVGVNSECIKLYDSRVYGKGPFTEFKVKREKECDWSALKFSKNGKLILISTNRSVIYIIDAFSGTPMQTLTGKINILLLQNYFVQIQHPFVYKFV